MFKKRIQLKKEVHLRSSKVKDLYKMVCNSFGTCLSLQDMFENGKSNIVEQTYNEGDILVWSTDDTPLLFTSRSSSFIYPSIYLLWSCLESPPSSLVPIYIPSPASKNILNGADVMCKGILNLSQILQQPVGTPVSIHVHGNPIPFAVGMISADLHTFQGMQGKGVILLHHYRDLLGGTPHRNTPHESFRNHVVLPINDEHAGDGGEDELISTEEEEEERVPPPPTLPDVSDKKEYSQGVEDLIIYRLSRLSLDEYPVEINSILDEIQLEKTVFRTCSLLAKHLAKKKIAKSKTKGNDVYITESLVNTKEEQECAQEILETLEEDLDHSLYQSIISVTDEELPIPASLFFSQFMKSLDSSLSLKHSPFKKLATYLSQRSKDGLLSVKIHRGELLITSVNRQHELLKHISKPSKLNQSTKPSKSAKRDTESKLQILYKYRPKSKINFIFGQTSDKRLYTIAEMKHRLFEYLNEQDIKRGKYIRVSSNDQPHPLSSLMPLESNGTIETSELVKYVSNCTNEFYAIMRPGDDEPNFKGGKPPRIRIDVKLRQGRKIVTLITGVESYEIDPSDLSSKCMKQFACSCSVTMKTVGTGPERSEVLVQGDFARELESLLMENYGILPSLLDVYNLKKKKR